jgi:hypothetical protein
MKRRLICSYRLSVLKDKKYRSKMNIDGCLQILEARQLIKL